MTGSERWGQEVKGDAGAGNVKETVSYLRDQNLDFLSHEPSN